MNDRGLRGHWHLLLAVVVPLAGLVGCDDDGGSVQPPSGVLSYDHQGSWSCAVSTSCQDVYDIEFADGSVISIAVTQVTGSSVVRLALFAPGSGLDGENLLTGTNADLLCTEQDSSLTVSDVALPAAGTYRLAVGRDWGLSAGFDGTYALNVSSTIAFTPDMQTADDEPSEAATAACQGVPVNGFETDGGWQCGIGVSCQDVYDFVMEAGSMVTIGVGNVTGNSVTRLALFAPGEGLDGVNLLIGSNLDRECVGQDENDETSLTLPGTGTYRLAVGRDWGSSAGSAGTYELSVTTPGTKFIFDAQTVDDGTSQAAGTTCATTDFQQTGSWSCGIGESCQDVYDLQIDAGTQLTISVSNVTGSSVVRLALFAPGTALSGTNLLNGANQDRECVGQDQDDQVMVAASQSGVYRLAVGRDWGSSAGTAGTYSLSVAASSPITPLGQTVEDTDSEAAGSTCP